jgi:hypothetical protein
MVTQPHGWGAYDDEDILAHARAAKSTRLTNLRTVHALAEDIVSRNAGSAPSLDDLEGLEGVGHDDIMTMQAEVARPGVNAAVLAAEAAVAAVETHTTAVPRIGVPLGGVEIPPVHGGYPDPVPSSTLGVQAAASAGHGRVRWTYDGEGCDGAPGW